MAQMELWVTHSARMSALLSLPVPLSSYFQHEPCETQHTDTKNISGTVNLPKIERLEIDKQNLSNGNVTLYVSICLFYFYKYV